MQAGGYATACACYDKNVQTCVWAVSAATRTAAKPTQNTPRLPKTPPIYVTGRTTWVGRQKREAMRREEGSGLITY